MDSTTPETNRSKNWQPYRQVYLPVKAKLLLAIAISCCWVVFCSWLAIPWFWQLSELFGSVLALLIVLGIAIIPGWANAFLICGLLIDRRPIYALHETLPGVSLLIAAYNEERDILETLESVQRQKYPGPVEVIVIDDGSDDATCREVERLLSDTRDASTCEIRLLRQHPNRGKAAALNYGLSEARYDIVVTIDADTVMYRHALSRIVVALVDGPERTGAVAGTVLVQNSRLNILTRLQEWDYFLGIAVVKRIQSLFQGTLVAQGAFSAYYRTAIEAVGGWENTVGEDIVLTWGLHELGYRVSYAENAFVFTHAPETYRQFFRQRKRWARGMIEAFKKHPGVFFRLRTFSPFIYLNLLFPYLDAAFLFFFLPGLVAAIFFQFYAIVGLMTLFLIPLMILLNSVMFFHQRRIFQNYDLRIRKHYFGLILYMLTYQAMMAPASTAGYLAEFFNFRKNWGTK